MLKAQRSIKAAERGADDVSVRAYDMPAAHASTTTPADRAAAEFDLWADAGRAESMAEGHQA